MTEFVALSEERAAEIMEQYLSAAEDSGSGDRVDVLRDSALQIASEASENTKRWLMEILCSKCGAPWSGFPDDGEELGDGCPCRKEPFIWGTGWPVTRAEYLSRTEPR